MANGKRQVKVTLSYKAYKIFQELPRGVRGIILSKFLEEQYQMGTFDFIISNSIGDTEESQEIQKTKKPVKNKVKDKKRENFSKVSQTPEPEKNTREIQEKQDKKKKEEKPLTEEERKKIEAERKIEEWLAELDKKVLSSINL